MKKKQKRIFICVVLVAVVFVIFTAINVNAFYNEGVDGIIVGDEDRYQSTYPAVVHSKQATHISDLKHALLSNVYIHEYVNDSGSCMQIRFRITYALPFAHGDMFTDTVPQVTDTDGTVLNSALIAVPDTVSGFHGMEYVLRFMGDEIPKPGEKIYFSFTSTEEGSDEAYASGKIEITMGA